MRSSIDQLENTNPILQERWLRGLNIERQNAIVSDTNKLLKLASELNAKISSSKPDSITPAQLSKVMEIEKRAQREREDEHLRTKHAGIRIAIVSLMEELLAWK